MASAAAADDQSKSFPPPTGTGYPGTHPVTGYSQTQSYPGYPPPYQGYPPPAYPGYPNPPNNYPYTAPPPAAYYSQHVPLQPEQSTRVNLARFMLTMMVCLVIGTFTMSVLTWLIFGADFPAFYVQSLTVPSFNITNNLLKTEWDANITVKNSNEKQDIFFDRLEAVMVHEETLLALSAVPPFQVGPQQEVTFNIKLSTPDVLPDHNLIKERNKEEVIFGLRMVSSATFRSGTMWRRHARLRVFCEDLPVKFAGPDGPGTLVGDGKEPKECVILA